ncbi:hypothetical protein Ddc_21224 [Ditylenchus destructor]|nr:hypothetical protein Ddc_21224 [Ditylenchus destructor]
MGITQHLLDQPKVRLDPAPIKGPPTANPIVPGMVSQRRNRIRGRAPGHAGDVGQRRDLLACPLSIRTLCCGPILKCASSCTTIMRRNSGAASIEQGRNADLFLGFKVAALHPRDGGVQAEGTVGQVQTVIEQHLIDGRGIAQVFPASGPGRRRTTPCRSARRGVRGNVVPGRHPIGPWRSIGALALAERRDRPEHARARDQSATSSAINGDAAIGPCINGQPLALSHRACSWVSTLQPLPQHQNARTAR